jgi:hypothetical protein
VTEVRGAIRTPMALAAATALLQAQDAVFLDPPWGGPDYRMARALDLYLGVHDVADITVGLFRQRAAARARVAVVAVKVPVNYNVHGLQAKLDAAALPLAPVEVVPMHKMLLLLVRWVGRVSQATKAASAEDRGAEDDDDAAPPVRRARIDAGAP